MASKVIREIEVFKLIKHFLWLVFVGVMIIIIVQNIELGDLFKEVKIGVHLPLKGVDVRDIDAGAHYELTVPNGERESGASLVPCVRKILLLYDLIAHNRFVGIRDIAILHHDGNQTLHKGKFECPTKYDYNCTLELTFSANYTRQGLGKDAVLMNVFPSDLYPNVEALYKNVDQPQLWLYFDGETPSKIYKEKERYNIPNLPVSGVWTYNSESIMYDPVGGYNPNITRNWDDVRQENKTGLVVWMASNCYHTFWPRWDFVKELQKHVSLDAYGTCGDKKCEKHAKECLQLIMTTYKFYLSLENAECVDYITEKVWVNALLNGVVPIVYGAQKKDYEKHLPPNSFIYVGDFESVQSLAEHINELDKRPDLYKKYFEWHGTVYPSSGITRSQLCDMIPMIDQMKSGKLEKKPLRTFPWFTTCRASPANAIETHVFKDWKPW